MLKNYDSVGSFLRPYKLIKERAKVEELEQARKDLEKASADLAKADADFKAYEGALNKAKKDLKSVEDECIKDLIKKQEELGLPYITDGEFRRSFWHLDFMWGFKGVGGESTVETHKINGIDARLGKVFIYDELSGKGHPFIEHYKFVQDTISGDSVAKLTIPSPAQMVMSLTFPELMPQTKEVYPDMSDMIVAIGNAYLEFIDEFYAIGGRHLQFDDCAWGSLVSMPEELVHDLSELYLSANNYVFSRCPEDLVRMTHVCRGNYKSQSFGQGPYTNISNSLFNLQATDVYYLEYDNDRSGGFEPLKDLGSNKHVVLGLVTSKTGELESEDVLISRVKEASQYVPLDRLSLSTQCGFASTEEGNALTEEEQWSKLRLIKEVSKKIWG